MDGTTVSAGIDIMTMGEGGEVLKRKKNMSGAKTSSQTVTEDREVPLGC